MGERLVVATVFVIVFVAVFWLALVRTVHHGTLTVPDLTGADLEEARRLAHDRGLAVEVARPGVFSETVTPGNVATQEPPPGFHVKSGATVTVRLSLGNERVAVPDVLGDSLQGATAVLEQEGLRPGRRATVRGQAAGDSVLATSPPTGAQVPPGAEVDLLLNETPFQRLWVMPSFIALPRTLVERFCQRHRFRIGQVHEVAYPGLAAGTILRQYPPAGSPLSRSDIIALWVSQ